MRPLLLSSMAIFYGYAYVLSNFVFLTAAADPAGRDEWIPASVRAGQRAISAGNNSVQVDNFTSSYLESHESLGQATTHSDYPRAKTKSFVQEQILVDISDDTHIAVPFEKDFTKCHHRKELLSNYSSASSAFIECAVINAKPVLYCGHCVLKFELSKKAWNDIINSSDCKEDILVSDKLQIVSQTQAFLVQLWEDGYCQNCYDEQQNFHPTNSTMDFLQKYKDTMTCFMNSGGSSDMPFPIGTNVTLCVNCSEEYKKLNVLYDSFSDDQLCMDIIDLMNRTRILWKDNHCRQLPKEFMAPIALSIFVCMLPFFFYLTAMLHGTKKQQKLVENSNNRNQRGLSASARLYAGTTTSLR